jgi:hypothetical protein
MRTNFTDWLSESTKKQGGGAGPERCARPAPGLRRLMPGAPLEADLASVAGLAVAFAEKPLRPAALARKVRELLDG